MINQTYCLQQLGELYMIFKSIFRKKKVIIKLSQSVYFSTDKPSTRESKPQLLEPEQNEIKKAKPQQVITQSKTQPLSLQNSHIDLKLSSLYQQILQKQRVRMQRNQLHIEQMLEKERERSDKRQQEMHEQITQFMKSLQTLIGVGGLMGLVFYIFHVVNQGGQAFQKMKKYWKEGYQRYELIQKYINNSETVPEYYLFNTSVQQELAKIQFDGIIGLSYLVGMPGSGKTTALKKVVHDLRLKIANRQERIWSKVYYINLRVDDQSGKIHLQKTKQRIDEMRQLLKVIFSSKFNYERALIIIDDIQVLDRMLPERQKYQILQSILLKCQMQSCKFVAVSSSSLSYYQARNNTAFKKSAFLTEVQSLTQEQLQSILLKRVQYEKQVNGIEIDQSIIKHLCEKYDSVKNMMTMINYVVNEYRINAWLNRTVSAEKLLQKIKQRQSNRIWQMRIEITKALRQKSQLLGISALSYLIECMLELPNQVKFSQKFALIEKVIKKYPKLAKDSDEINNVIQDLDRLNLLIFGRPRSKLERKAFQDVLKGFV